MTVYCFSNQLQHRCSTQAMENEYLYESELKCVCEELETCESSPAHPNDAMARYVPTTAAFPNGSLDLGEQNIDLCDLQQSQNVCSSVEVSLTEDVQSYTAPDLTPPLNTPPHDLVCPSSSMETYVNTGSIIIIVSVLHRFAKSLQ